MCLVRLTLLGGWRALGCWVVLWCCLHAPVSPQNLIVNGNFEGGNVGFLSDYHFDSTPPMNGVGYYAIGTTPKTWNSSWGDFSNHTPGGTLMMIVDGATTAGMVVWGQNVTVQPHTPYRFSFWAASSYSQHPATLRLMINGTTVGTDLTLPTQVGEWVEFSVLWQSALATTAAIRLYNLNTRYLGNDFVLDDIQMVAIPEPATFTLLLVGTAAILLARRKQR